MQTIRKAEGKVAYNQQMAGLVRSRREHSDKQFRAQRQKLPKLYDLYRGIATGRYHPHKNQVHVPLIFSTIQSDIARKVQTSFGIYPIVSMQGWGPDDAPIARKIEALIDAQMKDVRMFMKALDVYLNADLYGTAVVQHGWRLDEREAISSMPGVMPITGMQIQQVGRNKKVFFDGPDVEGVDLLDSYPQPGFKEIEEMEWFVVRRYLDLEDIRDLAEQGIFDQSEVSRLERESGGAANAIEELKSYRTAYTFSDSEEMARNMEKWARPVEVIEMWGTIPRELVSDGVRHRVITVANDRYVLRNRPNPYWHGLKPFLSYSPMPDPHYFHSPGKAEICEKLQVVANRFTNQILDVMDLFIDPAFFYDRHSGLDTRNLYMRPGRFIGVDGPPGDKIMPIIPNLQGVQAGTEQTAIIWKWMQQGTGIIEDVVQGAGGNRQTAREFLGRQEAVATRLMLESRIAEEMFVEPLANAFNQMNKQFLSVPKEIQMLGQSAEMDVITGMSLPKTMETIDALDLVFDYKARARGATTLLNLATRQQNLTLLLQAVSANPIGAQMVNWTAFYRTIFKAFEIDDVDELLAPAMNPMMQQMGMQGGVEGVPGLPGAPNQQGDESGGLAALMGTMTGGAPSA